MFPGAPEICDDGIDQDCDGADLPCDCDAADVDGDGHSAPPCGDDCDDTDPAVFPGAQEICDDGIDQDCNGSDCFADCPVDADGDGDDVPECGGGDCNDDDPEIRSGIAENCTDTPSLCDDGVDQNCDGSDCGCLFFLPGVRRWFSIQAEPVFLIASQGDDAYSEAESGGGNHGTVTMEVSPITVPDGHIGGWTTQIEELPNGQPVHGHEALLYFDYLWVFQGVRRENFSDLEPTPQTSAAQRFDWVEEGAADQVITNYQSSSAGVEIDRCYYSATRLNSYIYLIGGNGGPGTGALGDVERVIQ
ncbi:MAG: putative metal-binding motif-containing protein [Deltaproteobacteria bacterium]|nr:putative metal-binding motif-containing protein [Deltaproteobacteria bacterium]